MSSLIHLIYTYSLCCLLFHNWPDTWYSYKIWYFRNMLRIITTQRNWWNSIFLNFVKCMHISLEVIWRKNRDHLSFGWYNFYLCHSSVVYKNVPGVWECGSMGLREEGSMGLREQRSVGLREQGSVGTWVLVSKWVWVRWSEGARDWVSKGLWIQGSLGLLVKGSRVEISGFS